jgi:hypothetical protein
MTHLHNERDDDLHHPDGTHRETPPPMCERYSGYGAIGDVVRGSDVETREATYGDWMDRREAHLARHQQETRVSHYTGWNQPLRVTLTATSNPYLAPELPLVGLVEVLEMRTDAFAQPTKVRFQKLKLDDTTDGAPVMADDAEFTYTLPESWKEYRRSQQ